VSLHLGSTVIGDLFQWIILGLGSGNVESSLSCVGLELVEPLLSLFPEGALTLIAEDTLDVSTGGIFADNLLPGLSGLLEVEVIIRFVGGFSCGIAGSGSVSTGSSSVTTGSSITTRGSIA
jgi:hypothetical protein